MELTLGNFKEITQDQLTIIDGGKSAEEWAGILTASAGTIGFYVQCCAAAAALGPAGIGVVCGYLAASGLSGVAAALLACAD